ncbi:ABC transporter ATP-binding protein [Cytobacillus sp. Hm23]
MEYKLIFDHVCKSFGEGDTETNVLDHISLKVKPHEFVAVLGPSGSGKSTFLSLAGGLLTPSSGRIVLGDTDITKMNPKELNQVRLDNIGFIFQSSNLIPYLTVIDQLLLVAKLTNTSHQNGIQRANELITRLGLNHRKNSYPESLSGGERQRVAIARAWMNEPDVILADEPTASLDSERGRVVVQMLADEVKSRGKSAIMVTHDQRMLDVCDRIVYIEDGKLSESSNELNTLN